MKRLLILILLMISVFLITLEITFATFDYSKIGDTENAIKTGTYKGIYYENEWNEDGWPAIEARKYINNVLFNQVPQDLKNIIIDTFVVSWHDSKKGKINSTSTDKMYLLSSHEIWEDKNF